MERKTGFEPAAFSLARRCSTTELLPHRHVALSLLCNAKPQRVKLQIAHQQAQTVSGANTRYTETALSNPANLQA